MRSEAQKKADKKYYNKTYKNLQVSIKIDDYNYIDDLVKKLDISKASLIVKAIRYIYNNNVDIVNYNYNADDGDNVSTEPDNTNDNTDKTNID